MHIIDSDNFFGGGGDIFIKVEEVGGGGVNFGGEEGGDVAEGDNFGGGNFKIREGGIIDKCVDIFKRGYFKIDDIRVFNFINFGVIDDEEEDIIMKRG